MILDAFLEMADAQAVTATAVSTNIIDLGPVTDNVLRDIGTGEETYWCICVSTTFTGLTSIQASLESDSTSNLATSPTVHAVTPVLPVASLVAGYMYAIRLPAGNYERYLGTRFTVVGTGTLGNIDSFISKDAQTWRTYADRSPIDGAA